MRKALLLLSLACGALFWSAVAIAVDHNNVDDGRSLRFEGASSIGWHERAVEVGVGSAFPRQGSAGIKSKAEFLYGAFLNTHFGIAIEPSYSNGVKRFDASNLELSFFHAVRREVGNVPALAYRAGIDLPTGRDSRGVEGRLRGILTKALRQYDKIHVNVDGLVRSDPRPAERDASFGAVVGYTLPIGYPKSFTQTLLAEFAVQQSSVESQGWTGTVGIGMRKQIGVRSVVDAGFESDVFITDGAARIPFRLALGYSIGY